MNPFILPAFGMGLFGGVHCIAMCGTASCVIAGRFTLPFNLGRIAGYTALGLGAGALGAWTVGHELDGVRFAFRAVAAVAMLTVGLHLAGLPSLVHALESAGGPLWRRLAPVIRRLLPLHHSGHALAAGVLWSLMPCGLLYAALAMSASAYSILDGATTMLAFALGTLPIMLGAGALGSELLSRAFAQHSLRRISGVVVLAFGLWSVATLIGQVGLLPMFTVACH